MIEQMKTTSTIITCSSVLSPRRKLEIHSKGQIFVSVFFFFVPIVRHWLHRKLWSSLANSSRIESISMQMILSHLMRLTRPDNAVYYLLQRAEIMWDDRYVWPEKS